MIVLEVAIDIVLTVTAQCVQSLNKTSISVVQASENRFNTKESLSA
jgi:hypothetical protein